MKDMIITEKVREKERLFKDITDTIASTEVIQESSPVDFTERYIWAMSNTDLDVAKKLGLTSIKEYSRRAGQVELELDYLYNWISALATFVSYLHRVCNIEEVINNIKTRQNIDLKLVSSFFVLLYGSISYWKINSKDISEAAILVNEYV